MQEQLNQAFDLLRQNHIKHAVEQFDKILAQDPSCGGAFNGLGLVCVLKKDFKNAKEYFSKAVEAEPDNAVYHHYLANSLHHLDDFAAALCHYKKAIELNPEYAEAYNNLGNLYLKHHFINEAGIFYHQALAIKADYQDANFNLAQVVMLQEDYRLAKILWENVLQHSHEENKVKSAHFALGSIAYHAHDYSLTIHHQKIVLSLDENSVESIRQIAWSYIELKNYTDALFWCDELLELLPEDAVAQYNKGVVLLRQHQDAEAEACFRKSILFDAKQIDARVNLAMLELKKDRKAEAILEYKSILMLDPDHEIARYMFSALTGELAWQSAPATFVSQLYDNYAEHYEKNMLQQLQYQVPQLLADILIEKTGKINAKWDVLDLGCGTGLAAVTMKKFAKYLMGIDVSPAMIKQAEQKNIYDELCCMAMEKYLLSSVRTFDLIYAADSLLYTGDLSHLFLSIKKALKPNGYFIFSVEKIEKSESGYELQATGRFAHSEEYLQKMAIDAGFIIETIKPVILRQQKGEKVSGLICLVRKG